MDSYFNLWVIFYNSLFISVLKLCQICPGETPLSWLHSYWHVLIIIFSLSTSALSGTTKCSRVILFFARVSPGITCFPKVLVPFSGEWHLATKIWELGCSVLLGKIHLFNLWQQYAFYSLWCVTIHWSSIWLFSFWPLFYSTWSLAQQWALCQDHFPNLPTVLSAWFTRPSVLSPLSTEPQSGSLSASTLPGDFTPGKLAAGQGGFLLDFTLFWSLPLQTFFVLNWVGDRKLLWGWRKA